MKTRLVGLVMLALSAILFHGLYDLIHAASKDEAMPTKLALAVIGLMHVGAGGAMVLLGDAVPASHRQPAPERAGPKARRPSADSRPPVR